MEREELEFSDSSDGHSRCFMIVGSEGRREREPSKR